MLAIRHVTELWLACSIHVLRKQIVVLCFTIRKFNFSVAWENKKKETLSKH